MTGDDLRERIGRVLETIDRAAGRSARLAGEIKLVAVTKIVPAARVEEAIEAGLSVFGENRVQEARGKIEAARSGGAKAEWHLIGHLQSNKAKAAAGLFSMIHSVDSSGLASRIDRAAAGSPEGALDVLIQVNVSGETSKSGLPPDSLRRTLEEISALERIRVRGLMTIPPFDSDPERSRTHFAALRKLAEEARSWHIPRIGMEELSMGMTDDYPVAIEEGSTMVRIGRAIFGERR